MYSVSESYRAKMLDQVQTHRLTGTIDGVSFTDANVIGVSYTNQCSQKNVNIGSVNIGTLKLTFLTDILNRGAYQDVKITLSDSLYLGLDEDDQEVWESVPIGEFYVAEATWTAAGIDITAYDVMSKLDEEIQVQQTSGKIYSFCSYIAQETGTIFGMTEAQCDLLPNGTEVIAPYEENDIKTFRDLLSALAQMAGGFACAARDGSWVIRTFGSAAVVTVPKNRRMTGAEFSDFETLYDTVSFYDVLNQMIRYVGDNDGLVMNLDKNPFLQYGLFTTIEHRALNIVEAIKNMKYTPYKNSMLPAFVALDLGDVISFTDDFSGTTSKGAIMTLTWTYNKSFVVQCFGSNPALRAAQGRNDKNIAGLINRTIENEVTFYNFENIEDIDIIDEVETTIASLAFTATQTTTVKIMHEFILDMLRDVSDQSGYEIRYYLDEELLTYKPYESLGAVVAVVGEDAVTVDPVAQSVTRDLFYILRNVTPNIRHTWRVAIVTHGMSQNSTIQAGNAHVTLEGQRLYGEEYYDGLIEVRENITKIALVGMGIKTFTDATAIDQFTGEPIVVSENITIYDLGTVGIRNLTESIIFEMQGGFYIQSETGFNLTSEDGDRLITE